MIKVNYEMEGSYIAVREPIILKKTEKGFTKGDKVIQEDFNATATERGHELLAKGPKANIDAKPGDYVIISPSGFSTATILRVGNVRAMVLDSAFIVGRIKNADALRKKDAELEKLKKKEDAETLPAGMVMGPAAKA